MENKGTATPVLLVPLLDALRAQGHGVDMLLARLGITSTMLSQPGLRLDNALVLRAWEDATELGGENIGLEAATRYHPGMFHVIDYLVTTAPTLREGIELGARHLSLMHDLAEVVITDEGEMSHILQAPNRQIPVPRAENEFCLACLATICRRVLAVKEPFTAVHLPHPAPRDPTLARRFFGAAIHYDAECASLTLPRAYLDRESATADPHLARILAEYGALLLSQRSREDAFQLRVRHQMAITLPEMLSLDQAARALGVSARTLRRKLAGLGTSYQAVADDVRHETAARLLRDQQLSMEEVAMRVGFTSASTLSRAFRRWAGVSPARFRTTRGEPADSAS